MAKVSVAFLLLAGICLAQGRPQIPQIPQLFQQEVKFDEIFPASKLLRPSVILPRLDPILTMDSGIRNMNALYYYRALKDAGQILEMLEAPLKEFIDSQQPGPEKRNENPPPGGPGDKAQPPSPPADNPAPSPPAPVPEPAAKV